ncbi:hypothetical protein MYA98_07845 [Salmonella sp. WGH-01]|nr:hypothetical protein MYA98_07845 [Salmonella sp. WGH-01]
MVVITSGIESLFLPSPPDIAIRRQRRSEGNPPGQRLRRRGANLVLPVAITNIGNLPVRIIIQIDRVIVIGWRAGVIVPAFVPLQ